MADKKSFQLDPGFEEVALDEGFEEVPLQEEPSTLSSIGSDISDLGTSLGQGVTFGLADELKGGLKALGDAAIGKVSNKDELVRLYEQYRDLERQQYEDAKERSPYLTSAGEIGGAVLTGAATPLLGSGRLVAAAARKYGPKALGRFLSGAKGGIAGKVTGRGAGMAVEAAPIGAVAGLGFSEAPLMSEEAYQDVKSGALTGGIAGAALGGVTAAARSVPDALASLEKNNPLIGRIKESYKMGKEGINLGKKETMDKFIQETGEKAPLELVDKFLEVDRFFGQRVGQALTDAEKRGLTFDIDPDLTSATNSLMKYLQANPALDSDKIGQKLVELVQTTDNKVTPLQLRSINDSLDVLSERAFKAGGEVGNFAGVLASDLRQSIINKLKTASPEYRKAAEDFSQFRKLIPETIMGYGNPYKDVYMGSLKNAPGDLFQKTKRMLESYQKIGTSGEEGTLTALKLFENLKELEKINPEAIKQMGYESADQAISDITRKSNLNVLKQEVSGNEPRAGLGTEIKSGLSGASTTARGYALSAINRLGVAAGSKSAQGLAEVGKAVSAPLKAPAKIFELPTQTLSSIADAMEASGSSKLKDAGSKLKRAIELDAKERGSVATRATLFTLMQMPEAREMFKSYEEQE